ncbi:MAG TPA: hypothetical protein VNE40_03365 [Candidatus Dormibacteraeota bacterium]|nr:hypothetical protein [Candidatus Dormibacteraeota bacterium]
MSDIHKISLDFSSKLIHKLVGSQTVRWNPLLTCLIDLAEELEQLGLVYYDVTALVMLR